MRLIDVCEINPKAKAIGDNTEVSFVAMPDVSEDGKINTDLIRPYCEVKKGFTCFNEGDVLFAKITPCMENGKGALAVGLKNGIGCGSTEFHVLRPNTDVLQGKWLYYLTAWPAFRKEAERHMTGSAGQKRVPKAYLEKYELQIPTLSEQYCQIEVLDRVKAIIELRKQELQSLDELIKARFVEMFGDPVANDKSWATISLNDACDGIGDGLHGTPEYDDNGEYPFINGNNLIDGTIEITPSTKMVDEETYRKHYIEITDNAILISINGTLGKMAFYRGEKFMLGKSACYCNLHSGVNREFVYGVMKSDAFAEFLESNSTKSTIKNVGLKAMRGFRLIIPPEELQLQFVEFTRQVDKSKFVVQKSLEETQKLFDNLMQQYFG